MKQFILTASCSVLFVLTGCSTQAIKPYQPASPPISERTAQQSGVEVGIDPFVEPERTEKYFEVDAVGDGIAILHVRVANNTGNRTFLVEKKNFQLLPRGAAGGVTGDGKKIERPEAVGNAMVASGVVLNGLGGVLVFGLGGAAMISHSGEIQRNFTAQEMGDQTLSPGQSMEGFVYFAPVKHGEDWSRAANVRINLTETITQQMTSLDIPLSH